MFNGRILFAKYLYTAHAGNFSTIKLTAKQWLKFKNEAFKPVVQCENHANKGERRVFSGNKFFYVGRYVQIITRNRAYAT